MARVLSQAFCAMLGGAHALRGINLRRYQLLGQLSLVFTSPRPQSNKHTIHTLQYVYFPFKMFYLSEGHSPYFSAGVVKSCMGTRGGLFRNHLGFLFVGLLLPVTRHLKYFELMKINGVGLHTCYSKNASKM